MNEIATTPPNAVQEVTPSELLRFAIDKGADLERLEKLMDLQDRWQAAEAKRAFDRAMADFKATAPSLVKSRQVSFGGKGGTAYKHAELDKITQKLAPALARVGLSHSWRVEQGERIRVTCRLAHRDGHAEEVSLMAQPDTSGSKNPIQAIGSTITYLSRYSLLAVTGLATGTDDDDGQPEPADGGSRFIDAQQQEWLEAMIAEVGADRDAFIAWLGVPALAGLPKEGYQRAVQALEKKRSTPQAEPML